MTWGGGCMCLCQEELMARTGAHWSYGELLRWRLVPATALAATPWGLPQIQMLLLLLLPLLLLLQVDGCVLCVGSCDQVSEQRAGLLHKTLCKLATVLVGHLYDKEPSA
jgi:hypothetical protein